MSKTWLGYSYADTLHLVTHRHHEPLVRDPLIVRAREPINSDGMVVIPPYEHEVRAAVERLLEHSVDAALGRAR